VIVPSIQPLVAKWAPTGERSSISTFIFSGAQVGTVLGITCSGLIADSLGWEAVFYIQGCLSVIVVAAWLYVVYDSPELHPRISAKEREYIKSSTFTPANKVCFFACRPTEHEKKEIGNS
jgi:predicted MFS family arabinose efflux permease